VGECRIRVTGFQKPKALKCLSAGFMEQLMGNIIRKESMPGRFPKIVGFQTAGRNGLDLSELTRKLCGYTI
jgi:hypothetical protein